MKFPDHPYEIPLTWPAYSPGIDESKRQEHAKRDEQAFEQDLAKITAENVGTAAHRAAFTLNLLARHDAMSARARLPRLVPSLRAAHELAVNGGVKPTDRVSLLEQDVNLRCRGVLLDEVPLGMDLALLDGLHRDRGEVYDFLRERMGWIACVLGRFDQVPDWVAGKLVGKVKVAPTAGADSKSLLRHLASACRSRAPAAVVRPAWDAFVAAYPRRAACAQGRASHDALDLGRAAIHIHLEGGALFGSAAAWNAEEAILRAQPTDEHRVAFVQVGTVGGFYVDFPVLVDRAATWSEWLAAWRPYVYRVSHTHTFQYVHSKYVHRDQQWKLALLGLAGMLLDPPALRGHLVVAAEQVPATLAPLKRVMKAGQCIGPMTFVQLFRAFDRTRSPVAVRISASGGDRQADLIVI